MMLKQQLVLLVIGTLLTTSVMAEKNDLRGSSDHPLISRFPNTHINSYYTSEYDEFLVATGPRKSGEPLPPVLRLEGKTTTIGYEADEKKFSPLQIFRNYQKAFAQSGFTPIYTCKNDTECGNKFVTQLYWEGNPARAGRDRNLDAPNLHGDTYQYYFWSGKVNVEGKDIYASLLVAQWSGASFPAKVVLDIGEIEKLDDDLISINLDSMSQAITETGKVELKGILFDTAKTTLKPESAKVVETIANYIKQNPSKSFYVVGHTDSKGDYDFNINLSKGRASTVVNTLIKDYGIAAERIIPIGIGPVSPAQSNATEAGRTNNRRVELVLAD